MNIRNPKKEELSSVIEFVSREFEYPVSDRISRDFPQLFVEENRNHLWIKTDLSGAVLAHSGCYQGVLMVDNLTVSVGGIGGVCTDPAHRGHGYARELVEKCCDDLKSQGAALAFLWTGAHDLYRKLNFELAGRQWLVSCDEEKAAKFSICSMERKCSEAAGALTDGDWRSIYENYLLQPLGLKRGLEDIKKLLSSSGGRLFLCRKNNLIVAYMFIGKGKDLENCIHEWAGDEESLQCLLRYVLSIYKRELILLAPQFSPEESPFLYTLERVGFVFRAGYMGMVRILDPEKICELACQRVMALDLLPTHLVMELHENGWKFGWKDSVLEGLDDLSIIKLVFGPEFPSQLHDFGEVGNQHLNAVFPLRLWWWGMDSV